MQSDHQLDYAPTGIDPLRERKNELRRQIEQTGGDAETQAKLDVIEAAIFNRWKEAIRNYGK